MTRGARAFRRSLPRIGVAIRAFEPCVSLVRKRQVFLSWLCYHTQRNRRAHLPDAADLSRLMTPRALARGRGVPVVTPLAIARDRDPQHSGSLLGVMTGRALQRFVTGVLELWLLRWNLSPSYPPGRPRRHRHACLTRAAPGCGDERHTVLAVRRRCEKVHPTVRSARWTCSYCWIPYPRMATATVDRIRLPRMRPMTGATRVELVLAEPPVLRGQRVGTRMTA